MPATNTEKLTAAARVRQHLADQGFKDAGEIRNKRNGHIITLYLRNGRSLLVHEYADGGCEVYGQLSPSINLQLTLDAITTYGIE